MGSLGSTSSTLAVSLVLRSALSAACAIPDAFLLCLARQLQESCRIARSRYAPEAEQQSRRSPRIVPMRATLLLLTAATALVPPPRPLRPQLSSREDDGRAATLLTRVKIKFPGAPRHRCDVVSVAASARWRGEFSRSTRRCPRGCVGLYGVEAHDGLRTTWHQDYLNSLVDFHTGLRPGHARSLKHWNGEAYSWPPEFVGLVKHGGHAMSDERAAEVLRPRYSFDAKSGACGQSSSWPG